MSITPEQRQQWREDAEAATYYGGNEQEQADRILALLDALDAAQAEALREAADVVGSDLANEIGSGHTSTYSVRKWLRERADRIEGQP